MTAVLVSVLVVLFVLLVLLASGVRMVQQYERGVVLRFGRLLPEVRQPGLNLIIPFTDRMTKLSVQTIVLNVPSQSTITRDNVNLAPLRYRPGRPRHAALRPRAHQQRTQGGHRRPDRGLGDQHRPGRGEGHLAA
jgi:regulator of protease activity HflC (stomatin/prohibitin superfamily)